MRNYRLSAALFPEARCAMVPKKIEKSEQREKNCLDAEAVLLYNRRVATQLN